MRYARLMTMVAGTMLLAAPAWAQAGTVCTALDQPLRPIMTTHTIPPYPEVSVMTEEAGTTMLEVNIGPDGVPTKTAMVASSGSLRLDAAAAEYVKNVWRWQAPTRNCQPVAVVTRVAIKWDLRDRPDEGPKPPTVTMDIKDYPPGAKQRHEQGEVTMMMLVAPDGTASPRVTKTSGFPELDDKSMELAKTWRFTPATLNGRPVTTPVFLLSIWSLEPKK